MIDLRKIDKDRPYTEFSKEQLKEFLDDIFNENLYKLDKIVIPKNPDWSLEDWIKYLKECKIEFKSIEE